MTSIDKFTFEDSDNEDTYHISGGDREALVYDIPKNIQHIITAFCSPGNMNQKDHQ